MNLKKIQKIRVKHFIFIIIAQFINKKSSRWIFQDRIDKANDNAQCLYEYVSKNNIHDDIYFVIDKDCYDYKVLKENGFKLLKYNSLKHYIYLYNAELFISSHLNENILKPWSLSRFGLDSPKYKLIFLQHGILRSDLSHWFNKKKIDMLCTSSKEEYDNIVENSNYEIDKKKVVLTGLARHDKLDFNLKGEYILIFPTWRSYLEKDKNAINSVFAKTWISAVTKISNTTSKKVIVVLHSSLKILENDFKAMLLSKNVGVEFIEFNKVQDFSQLISKSSCLITDFSSIAFEAIYLNKPVMYYVFKEEEMHFTNQSPDYSINKKLGYLVENEMQLIDTFKSLESVNFSLEQTKIDERNSFFAYSDKENCKRIINEIEKRRE